MTIVFRVVGVVVCGVVKGKHDTVAWIEEVSDTTPSNWLEETVSSAFRMVLVWRGLMPNSRKI